MSIQESIASRNPEPAATYLLTDLMRRISRAQHLSQMPAAALLDSAREALEFATHTLEQLDPYFVFLSEVQAVTNELVQVMKEMHAAGDDCCMTLPASVAGVLLGQTCTTPKR